MELPLRISPDRVLVYAVALFLIGLWQLLRVTIQDPSHADWAFFWTGGATVGSSALLNPTLHFAFEAAHHFVKGIWPYLPAYAWLYVPASRLSLDSTYVINFLVMLGIAAFAGIVLADAFSMPKWLGAIMALAWPPIKVAAVGGQNTPLALVLIALAIWAARRQSPLLLGLFIGLLLYKPSIGAPYVIVLLARREWRALSVVAACALCWYILSVPATGGNWAWPAVYIQAIRSFYTPDFLSNASNAVSIPGMLVRVGVSPSLALATGIALLLLSLPLLAKLKSFQAFSVTSVLAIAISPHAWHYEPAIMLPAILYALMTVRQPIVTWLVAAAYVLADVSIFDISWLPWNVLAIVVLFWTALLLLRVYPGVTTPSAAST